MCGLPHWHLCQVLLSRRSENIASLLPGAGPRGCAQQSPQPAACRATPEPLQVCMAGLEDPGQEGGPRGARAGRASERVSHALLRRLPQPWQEGDEPLLTHFQRQEARQRPGLPVGGSKSSQHPPRQAERFLPPLLQHLAAHSHSSSPLRGPPGLDVAGPQVLEAPGQPGPRSCRSSMQLDTLHRLL